jgi:uncharacterized protein
LFESLPGYLYAISRDGIYVNLYHASNLDWHLEDGTPLKMTQVTNYPWTGDVRLTLNPAHPAEFTVYLRWPGWAPAANLQVNDKPFSTAAAARGSFIAVSRNWKPGDTITLSLPVEPVAIFANPKVVADYGRIAMMRGPLVYALEQIDQNGASLNDIFARPNGTTSAEVRKDLLGGITILKVPGQVAEKALMEDALYVPLPDLLNRPKHLATLTLIPYFTIANREPSPMEVWIPLSRVDEFANGPSGASSERRSFTR